MRKIVALILVCAITLCGCSNGDVSSSVDINKTIEEENSQDIGISNETTEIESVEADTSASIEDEMLYTVPDDEEGDDSDYEYEPSFTGLDDEALLSYLEDDIYSELVEKLDNDKYYVENVEAVYVSKEYLEEVSYNSQSNIFFGYTLEDIQNVYGDTKFVFTLGDDGDTAVEPFEDYDDTYDQIIKNVAIGTGVILICVTVSVVTAGAGAPAVSLIFAASAKTGTVMALSGSVFSGVAEGVVTGMETKDMNKALKAAALSASESYKWGAITGTITGGASESMKYAKAMKALKGMELNLTTQEAAAIQMETGFPADVISQFHSMDEYQVFKDASLKAMSVNGETALVRKDFDMTIKDSLGRNNLERMKQGLSPFGVDAEGNVFKYELHHIGQESDATLAILTTAEHDNAALHGFKAISEINRPGFDGVRRNFWKTMAKMIEGGAI